MARGTKIEILAPLVRGRKGEFRDVFESARKRGFVRVRVDGEVYDLAAVPKLNRRQNHAIYRRGGSSRGTRAPTEQTGRLDRDRAQGGGRVGGSRASGRGWRRSSLRSYACPKCGLSLPELEPRQFSFNSPFGACPTCSGLGTRREVAADLVLGDARLSILEGVVLPWGEPSGYLRKVILPTLARTFKFNLDAAWQDLPAAVRKVLLHGVPGRTLTYQYDSARAHGEYRVHMGGSAAPHRAPLS